ncbi:DUF4124 domain-containing protein [Aquitalea sp. ASV11]|uniref:DUF4124 domain-containing protein n=1 Tax=Aquitalea sp. ASV11 TaxID=2795103 RepID=UPI0018EC269C|nr:DUF4124 domain-containing protein [Aquitalea sp. ASV11]
MMCHGYLALLLCALPVSAQVFKCLGPQRQIQYQDHPCPADHQAQLMQQGSFSLITREYYQIHGRVVMVTEERSKPKRVQPPASSRLASAKACDRLQTSEQRVQQNLLHSRSAKQTKRFQRQLAKLQQALQDARCSS